MPPRSAAADFLSLEAVAGDRSIPDDLFHPLLASVYSPSNAFLRDSQRFRRAVALRALDAALRIEGASSSLLLHRARQALAEPDTAACFPHQIPVAGDEENDDEARAAAAVADLRRLLDHEWANLPPSTLTLVLANGGVPGYGGHQTWPAADHAKRTRRRLLVEESTEREILAKLVQVGSSSHQSVLMEVADNMSNVNEADGAHSSDENNEAGRGQEAMAGNQSASVKEAEGRLSEKSVSAFKKCSPMERNPNASTDEWVSSDDQPVQKRSEIEEKTLLEGVEKYGKANGKISD